MAMSSLALAKGFGGNILLAIIGFAFSGFVLIQSLFSETPNEKVDAINNIIIEIFNIAIGVMLIVLI